MKGAKPRRMPGGRFVVSPGSKTVGEGKGAFTVKLLRDPQVPDVVHVVEADQLHPSRALVTLTFAVDGEQGAAIDRDWGSTHSDFLNPEQVAELVREIGRKPESASKTAPKQDDGHENVLCLAGVLGMVLVLGVVLFGLVGVGNDADPSGKKLESLTIGAVVSADGTAREVPDTRGFENVSGVKPLHHDPESQIPANAPRLITLHKPGCVRIGRNIVAGQRFRVALQGSRLERPVVTVNHLTDTLVACHKGSNAVYRTKTKTGSRRGSSGGGQVSSPPVYILIQRIP